MIFRHDTYFYIINLSIFSFVNETRLVWYYLTHIVLKMISDDRCYEKWIRLRLCNLFQIGLVNILKNINGIKLKKCHLFTNYIVKVKIDYKDWGIGIFVYFLNMIRFNAKNITNIRAKYFIIHTYFHFLLHTYF